MCNLWIKLENLKVPVVQTMEYRFFFCYILFGFPDGDDNKSTVNVSVKKYVN